MGRTSKIETEIFQCRICSDIIHWGELRHHYESKHLEMMTEYERTPEEQFPDRFFKKC